MQTVDPRDTEQFPLVLTMRSVLLHGLTPFGGVVQRRPARCATPEENFAIWIMAQALDNTKVLAQQERM